MSVENPTLAHFRHFSSLLTNEIRSTKEFVRKNKLFMQNEPKFRKVKFNVNKVLTREYVQLDTWSIRKNEPKTNPNEPKTNPILANKTIIRTQFKPKQTQFLYHWTSLLFTIVSYFCEFDKEFCVWMSLTTPFRSV